MSTDPIKVSVRQYPQQSGLQFRGHIADFVEKQRAALGLFKAPTTHRLGAGEGTALVTEELTFEQIARDSGRIERHERLVSAGTVAMQSACDQLFSGSRFARHQHGHTRLRQSPDRAENFLHGGRLTQHVGRFGEDFFDSSLALALGDGATNQIERLGQVERLRQVLKRAALERLHRGIQVGECSHDDDG